MTNQSTQPFHRKPLVRFSAFAGMGLLLLIGGIVLNGNFQEADPTKSAALTAEALNARVAEAVEFSDRGQLQSALDILNPIRKEIFEQGHVIGLRTFAEARATLPEAKDGHVLPAVGAFMRLAEVDPEDTESRVHLFQLFRRIKNEEGAVRFGSEAVALKPDDHRLRLLLADVQLRTGDAKNAEEHARTVLAADSNNIEAATLVVRCRVADGDDSTTILELIDGLCDQSDQKKTQLDRTLLSLVLARETNDTETAELLAGSFAPNDINESVDQTRVEMIIAALGSAGRSQDVISAAARSADTGSSSSVEEPNRLLSAVRRYLWAGEHQRVLDATETAIDVRSGNNDELVILRFMSLWLENDRTELRPMAEAMSKLQTHRARVWTPVLQELAAAEPKTEAILKATSAALAFFPESPCLTLLNAESLIAIGDPDGAIVAFRNAIAASPRWAHARIRLAELFTQRSQPNLAFAEALEAVKAVPHSTKATHALIVSVTRLREAGGQLNKQAQAAMLKFVQRTKESATDDTSKTLLDAAFHFLRGDAEQTDTAVAELLAKPESLMTADLTLLEVLASNEPLRREAKAIRHSKAGLRYDDLLFDCVEAARKEGPTAALLYLETAKLGNRKLPKASQRFLYAETLSILRDKDAKIAWISLANDYPRELRIQQRAATDPGLADDFSARQKIVNNIKAVSSEETTVYQIEAARLLLDKDDSQQAAAQAALTMTELLKTATTSTQAMRLAIRAFERLNKPERVLSILRDASGSGMRIPDFQLRLAEQSSTREEAVRSAKSFLAMISPSSPLRGRAINVLLQHGEYRTAAHELSVNLPRKIEDTDEHFHRFSALAVAMAYNGNVKEVLRPIETLAPNSNRWFKLWLDITEVASVAKEDAFAMLIQAAEWSEVEPESRKRQLSVAWRRLARRSPDKRCLEQAFAELNAVVDSTADASEQMLLAGLAIKADQPDVAATVYDQLVARADEKAPYHAIALNNLASLKLTSGTDLHEASALADRAWQLQQKPEFVDTLIDIRLKQNRKQEALVLLEEGIKKWPQNPRLKRLATRFKTTSAAPHGS